MTKIFSTILFCLLAIYSCVAQEKTAASIQEAIDQHIQEFKNRMPNYGNIYLSTKLDDQLVLSKNVVQIEASINPKLITKKERNYLIVVRLASQFDHLKIDVINYSITKKSNRELKLTNLNNGATYEIRQGAEGKK